MKKTIISLLLVCNGIMAIAQTKTSTTVEKDTLIQATDTSKDVTTIVNKKTGVTTIINKKTLTSTTVNPKKGTTVTVNLLTGVATTKDKLGNDSQWKPYEIGATSEYRATVLNSNFTVPLLRFNSVTGDNTKKGSVSLFNSVGAGIGISWGRLEATTDNAGNLINTEMSNTIGLQLGILFAANTSSGNEQNIFAPTVSFSVLNFQVGYGYELGTIAANQNRGFVTIAYGIPLSKLVRGGFFILRRTPDPVHVSNKAATQTNNSNQVNPNGVTRTN